MSNNIEKEVKRLRIAKIRQFNQGLIGCKTFDKNTTFNGMKINGTPRKDLGLPKRKTDDAADPVSSDDEILNAVNQYTDAITLSVYDDKNLSKKKFQQNYYNTPSIKGELVQNRCSMVDQYKKSS